MTGSKPAWWMKFAAAAFFVGAAAEGLAQDAAPSPEAQPADEAVRPAGRQRGPFRRFLAGSETHRRIERRTYDFEEAKREMEYALFVPTTYEKENKAPLIVALHGLGSNPQQIIRYPHLTALAEKHGYIVVAPMGYNEQGWYGSRGQRPPRSDPPNLGELSERDVLNVLERTREEFSIDEDRIYLMGHSMGGAGAWHLGIKYPDLWAGLAPIAPAPSIDGPGALDKIKHLPVIVIQGDKDLLVRAAETRRWVEKMRELGMNPTYIEVEGGGHLDVAFDNMPKVIEFFNAHMRRAAQSKQPNAEKD